MNQELGKTIGGVNAEVASISAFLDDPITRQSGCADELMPHFSKAVLARIETILRNAGYTHFRDFIDEVELRTSPKWAYFYSGIAHLDDIHGGTFFGYDYTGAPLR